jgi:hypothetical protein
MPVQAAGAPPDLSSGVTSGSAKRALSPIPRAIAASESIVGIVLEA